MYTCRGVSIFLCMLTVLVSRPQVSSAATVKLSFIHVANLFLGLFPTQFLTPLLSHRWHLSTPILTRSFLLALLCRTPANTTVLPTRLHGSVIGRCWDGYPFQPIADQKQVVMRPCSGRAEWSRVLGRRGECNTRGRHKRIHT